MAIILNDMRKSTRTKSIKLALLLILALCCLTTTAANAQPVSTFSAKYTLGNNYVTGGKAKLILSKKEDHYQLLLETKPTGVFRLSKKGKTREVAELPSLNPPFLSDKYSYTNFGDKSRSFTSIFNRSNGEATFVRNGSTTKVAIDTNVVDRLSMTLSLMQHVHTQPEIENFSIDTIATNGTQTFSFVSKGQVSLKTNLGNLTTTRIDRQRSNSNRNTITWLAPMGPDTLPIPVQIEQYKRGKLVARLKITEFSIIE